MKILSAEFVTSATDVSGIPRDAHAQVAFVGRSNVGKSTLINALVRSKVARTSAAPGKTTLLNLYRIRLSGVPAPSPEGSASRPGGTTSRTLHLVDMPGYGYARGGARTARAFDTLTRQYFGSLDGPGADRSTASAAILAVDARHPGLTRDVDAHTWLAEIGLPLSVVATKADRVASGRRHATLRAFDKALGRAVLPVSAVSGEGIRQLWQTILRLIQAAERREPS